VIGGNWKSNGDRELILEFNKNMGNVLFDPK